MPDKIYFISGLGADKRVFVNLNIDHPSQHHIVWESPYKKETIQDYCKRLILQIDLASEVILIGVSFGGIIAQEIAGIIPVKKVIILSSIKDETEFDWQLKLVRKTKLHTLFGAGILKWLNKLTAAYYFGIKSKPESNLLKQIIADTDEVFMIWAIDAIMKWEKKNTVTPIHIHGTFDKIFPINNIKNYTPVQKGGHWMIYNRASELSEIINYYLKR